MYKKIPITDKIRTCLLPDCGLEFKPSRQDQKYCCRQHNEKHWHIKHPRVYKSSLPPTLKPYEICGNDNIRRDTPKLWLRYMKKNPIYFEMLGKFENKFNSKGE
jgi:hypothetical protein